MIDNKGLLDILRIIIMGIIGILERLFGGYDTVFFSLVIFMSLDYMTGVLSAIVNRKLNSKLGGIGLLKKFGILSVIAMTVIIEKDILCTTGIRDAVILYYISNEGISILENLCYIGVPVPAIIKNVLKNMNEENDTRK